MMSVKQTVGQDPNKITALYERLSRDDDQVGDSNSIVNQKKYLESYAEQRGYTNIQHYTDDGWSGGNFNRPAWKQLEADIEAGKVAHVIVKDMSRIGRDYLQTGFYTEVFFREHGVHFIAIPPYSHRVQSAAFGSQAGVDRLKQPTVHLLSCLSSRRACFARIWVMYR